MLRTSDVKITWIHLAFLFIWFTSSAEGGQILSELKEISSSPTTNEEGRFLRLRTCHESFVVQCKPCEIMRIVNASYAANGLHTKNPINVCSDINFQHEFDCLQPVSSLYLEEIVGSCDGNQTCELKRDKSSFSCGSFRWSWSCCVEINYTCEAKKDLMTTSFFAAGDPYGNVNNVSLQCPSSDLSIDSVELVFNSSVAVSDGQVCYKASANINNLKKHCEKQGCSGIYVAGARGCGRDDYLFNNGIYLCYTCKGSRVSQTTETTQQPSLFGGKTTIITQGNRSTEAKIQLPMTTQSSVIPSDGHPTTRSMPKQNETLVIESSHTTQDAITAVHASTKRTATTKMSLETTESKIWTDSSSLSPSSTATIFTVTSAAEGIQVREVKMLVFSGTSLVGGVLMCFIAGCIVFRKRRRTRQTVEIQRISKLYRNRHLDDEVNEVQTRAESSHRYTYLHGPEEGYQETAEYTYAIDLEDTLKQKGRGAEGRIDDEAGGKSTGNGSGVSIYALQKEEPKRAIEGAPYDCPEPVKLELKINPNLISESKMNLKPVSGNAPKKDNAVLNLTTPKKPKPAYADQPKKANVSVYALQKQEPTTMYAEVNRSKQRLKSISEAVDSVTDNLEPGYPLLKKEKPPTFTEVNSSKQKLKPISEAVNSVRDDQVPVYSLMKQEPTPTFTEVNSSKQKLKPVYKNANLAKGVVKPVYALLGNPGQDLIPTSKEVSRPTIKPKPCQKVAPYPTKKDSKQFSVPVKKSITSVTGSGAQVPLPASEGGNKMASSQISYDEEETYDTHKIDTTEGMAVENDLYAEVIT